MEYFITFPASAVVWKALLGASSGHFGAHWPPRGASGLGGVPPFRPLFGIRKTAKLTPRPSKCSFLTSKVHSPPVKVHSPTVKVHSPTVKLRFPRAKVQPRPPKTSMKWSSPTVKKVSTVVNVTDRGQTAQAWPGLTQEKISPWAGACALPHSN